MSHIYNKMKVYELYSGIGGMHFALKESEIDAEIVRAIDINTTANEVYRYNFPDTYVSERNIQNFSKADFGKVDMILMSPPCQPHTRNGLKKDMMDERSNSLIHLLSIIPEIQTLKYILLENVKGFEISGMRDELIHALNDSGFIYQEFMLTPRQFSIPNSRLRYYLLAKKKPLEFCFSTENIVMEKLPELNNTIKSDIAKIKSKYESYCSDELSCYPIGQILDNSVNNLVPEKVLRKYGKLFDIVTSESTKSCCFTKGYTHFVEGTGSVYSPKNMKEVNQTFLELTKLEPDSDTAIQLLKSLELRYFTPNEISKLMSFPGSFKFPKDLSDKQKYRLLGNSINVHIVAILIKILVS